MADQPTTTILGIPIPSEDPVFLAIVGVHIILGLAAIAAGAVAMFSKKGHGRHSRWGTMYFWALTGVFVTMGALSFIRWSENYPLFLLGASAFACGLSGRLAAARQWPHWVLFHVPLMGMSYALMLTAFYVDNGKNLPLWNALPPIVFWLFPTTIAGALITNAIITHPVVRALEFRARDRMEHDA